MEYVSSSCMKVIGQGQGHRSKKVENPYFRNETSSGHNSGSMKDRSMRSASIMGVSDMTGRVL